MAKIRIRYTKEQKLNIVNESLELGASLREISENYDVHENTLRRWRNEYARFDTNSFPGHGNKKLTDEQREIERLKKELRETRLANEILKKAMGIVASPNRKDLLL
jgi:transposase